jgi:hypothetical protein
MTQEDKMSLIVSTNVGRFRQVIDAHGKKSFLFECPECKEWLPMSEQYLNGTLAPIHFARRDDMVTMTRGRICTYTRKTEYGAVLVSTMQAKLLMASEGENVKPYDTDYSSLYLGE